MPSGATAGVRPAAAGNESDAQCGVGAAQITREALLSRAPLNYSPDY
jgi:hypothetical protein